MKLGKNALLIAGTLAGILIAGLLFAIFTKPATHWVTVKTDGDHNIWYVGVVPNHPAKIELESDSGEWGYNQLIDIVYGRVIFDDGVIINVEVPIFRGKSEAMIFYPGDKVQLDQIERQKNWTRLVVKAVNLWSEQQITLADISPQAKAPVPVCTPAAPSIPAPTAKEEQALPFWKREIVPGFNILEVTGLIGFFLLSLYWLGIMVVLPLWIAYKLGQKSRAEKKW